jgi:hypothetical protein
MIVELALAYRVSPAELLELEPELLATMADVLEEVAQ